MTKEVKELIVAAKNAERDLRWWLKNGSVDKCMYPGYYSDTESMQKELKRTIEAVKKPTIECIKCDGTGMVMCSCSCSKCNGAGRVSTKGCD